MIAKEPIRMHDNRFPRHFPDLAKLIESAALSGQRLIKIRRTGNGPDDGVILLDGWPVNTVHALEALRSMRGLYMQSEDTGQDFVLDRRLSTSPNFQVTMITPENAGFTDGALGDVFAICCSFEQTPVLKKGEWNYDNAECTIALIRPDNGFPLDV
jgi:hypothetical protein